MSDNWRSHQGTSLWRRTEKPASIHKSGESNRHSWAQARRSRHQSHFWQHAWISRTDKEENLLIDCRVSKETILSIYGRIQKGGQPKDAFQVQRQITEAPCWRNQRNFNRRHTKIHKKYWCRWNYYFLPLEYFGKPLERRSQLVFVELDRSG